MNDMPTIDFFLVIEDALEESIESTLIVDKWELAGKTVSKRS